MKTIKVTNSYIAKVMPTIFNGQVIQNPVAESLKKKKLPTLMQYWSRRALDKITQLFKAYEETRQELIQQHAKKDKEGKVVPADDKGNVSIENMVDFQKDINELMEVEIDLGINLIKIDLKAWEDDKRYDILSGEEMDLLWPMLDIE